MLTGFGTEDSHHALHDFVWTPDGDLIFRESIFHHSQVETPYGPVRQQNSGWFRFTPRDAAADELRQYPSTNPWGVTFDDWGQHVASHPVFAAAFHALDPPYPQQHPAPDGPAGLLRRVRAGVRRLRRRSPTSCRAASSRCATSRRTASRFTSGSRRTFGYDEEYVGDLLFSTNLSFIPVDLQFGPRGDLYVCDWYNPVKGHMQYSLRDERRDRTLGPHLADHRQGQAAAGAAADRRRVDRRAARTAQAARVPLPLLGEARAARARSRRGEAGARRVGRAALTPTIRASASSDRSGLDVSHDRRGRTPTLLRELLGLRRPPRPRRGDAAASLLAPAPARRASTCCARRPTMPTASSAWRPSSPPATSARSEALDAVLDVLKHPRGGHLAYAIRCCARLAHAAAATGKATRSTASRGC